MNEEIPKYRRKTASSTSKSKKKSKHKHQYADCLIYYKGFKTPRQSGYCIVCGKIGSGKERVPARHEGSRWIPPTATEILEAYKDCPVFRLDEFFVDYVSLEVNHSE